MAFLQLNDISMEFSGIHALDGVKFAVRPGTVTSLIGPNGAGKTTLVNIITGVLKPTSGTLSFEGQPLDNATPRRIAKRGIRRTFQTVRLFPGLTVMENLIIGQYANQVSERPFASLLPFGWGDRKQRDAAQDVLQRFELDMHAGTVASELAYGTQRRVEIARALVGEPKLLILDEPAAGMNDVETAQLRRDIEAIRASGVTVFLIEHDMSLVMAVSDDIVVLDFGKQIAQGSPDEVSRNPEVIKSYLGAASCAPM